MPTVQRGSFRYLNSQHLLPGSAEYAVTVSPRPPLQEQGDISNRPDFLVLNHLQNITKRGAV